MALCVMKDSNEITLRKYINIFTESEWTIKILSGLKVKREKAENYFQRDLEMRNDSYNVRIQDIGPAKRQEILQRAKPQLSPYNSLIYDVIMQKREGSTLRPVFLGCCSLFCLSKAVFLSVQHARPSTYSCAVSLQLYIE